MSEAAIGLDPYALLVDFWDEWTSGARHEIPFYVDLASRAAGPVVELGAGNGRVAIPVAEAGKDVIAVDTSAAMLTDGARRAAEAGVGGRITWVEAPMQSFVADPAVELVFIPCRTFLHLRTAEEQLQALASIRASLVPGGRFACSFFVPDPMFMAAHQGERRLAVEATDERGRRAEVWSVPEYRVEDQGLTMRVIVDVYEGERLAAVSETALELRLVYRYEMEHLLARAGFEVEALYGGFDGHAFGPGDREMIWVARRP